jgi:hypothetical protein
MQGGFLDRINKINRIGKCRGILTRRHEIMKYRKGRRETFFGWD